MSSWKKAVGTCAKQLTGLQSVSISIEWGNFFLMLGQTVNLHLVEDGMRWKNNLISSVLTLKKLPLKTATIIISDQKAEQVRHPWDTSSQSAWMIHESDYRWTMDEKKERARYVREILLQS